RLTWQIIPRNMFSAMYSRIWKSISADIVSSLFGLGQGMSPYNATDPNISSLHRDPVLYYIAQGKWTGTLTPRLLFQAGFSLNKEDFDVVYQPGIRQDPLGILSKDRKST